MFHASIIIPVYFNEKSLPLLIEKTRTALAKIKGFTFDIVFVDDGSGDGSYPTLRRFQAQDKRIKIIKLTRNFGSQNAIMAGLSRVQSDCQIVMGADLQAPPEILPLFLEEWKKGHKIVVGSRQERRDPLTTILLANLYYFLIRLSVRNIPKHGFDFFLMDDKVRRYLMSIGFRNTLLEVSILWSGYKPKEVPYIRLARPFGRSYWTLFRKIKLALDSLTSYSYLPILFLFLCGASLGLAGSIGLARCWMTSPEAGPGDIRVLLSLGLIGMGLIGFSLWILGEFLWRNLEETRRFPGFLVEEEIGFKDKGRKSPQ